jgi:uncharacterized protein with HEPN domain
MHLRDILASIDLIEGFVGEMDLQAYRGDIKTASAVERWETSSGMATIKLTN